MRLFTPLLQRVLVPLGGSTPSTKSVPAKVSGALTPRSRSLPTVSRALRTTPLAPGHELVARAQVAGRPGPAILEEDEVPRRHMQGVELVVQAHEVHQHLVGTVGVQQEGAAAHGAATAPALQRVPWTGLAAAPGKACGGPGRKAHRQPEGDHDGDLDSEQALALSRCEEAAVLAMHSAGHVRCPG